MSVDLHVNLLLLTSFWYVMAARVPCCVIQVYHMPGSSDNFVTAFRTWLSKYGGGGPFGAMDGTWLQVYTFAGASDLLHWQLSIAIGYCCTLSAQALLYSGRHVTLMWSWDVLAVPHTLCGCVTIQIEAGTVKL